ncbi:sulfate transporter CysZ [Methylothermus subterraneus]
MSALSFDTKKLNHPGYALRCLGRGILLLGRPPLRRFVLIPLLLNLILFAGAFALASHFFTAFLSGLIPDWLNWLHWLLWPLFALAFVLIAFFSFALVANLLASPFYAKLAERTEQMVTGQTPKPQEAGLLRTLLEELGGEVQRLGYFLRWAVPLAILSLIPGVNLIVPGLWLGFNAWFLGLEYSAYPLANAGLRFAEARRLLSQARVGGLTLGGAVMLGLGIPLVNVFLPPAAVIAATLYFVNARVQTGSATN